MELLKLAALCTVCLLPVVLLRGKNPEQALLLTLGIMLAAAARCLHPASDTINTQHHSGTWVTTAELAQKPINVMYATVCALS